MSTCRNGSLIWMITVCVFILAVQPTPSQAQRSKGAAIAVGILGAIALGALLNNRARAAPAPAQPAAEQKPVEHLRRQRTEAAIVGPSLLPEGRAGEAPDRAPRPDAKVLRTQIALARIGFDPGPADGLLGARTRRAIARFQINLGQRPTGTLTADQRQLLWEAGS